MAVAPAQSLRTIGPSHPARFRFSLTWLIEARGQPTRELSFQVAGPAPACSVTALLDGDPLQHARATAVFDNDLGLLHVESPGLLSLTIRVKSEACADRPLYASTPLLLRLGVPGGACDPPRLVADDA